jgi:hypothetical protein
MTSWRCATASTAVKSPPRVFASGPFLQKTVRPVEAEFRWEVHRADDARQNAKLIDAGADLIKVIDQDQMTVES